MKNFLRRFLDIFVVLCLITFLTLITYYSETCDTYYSICLIFVSLFTVCLAFVQNHHANKQKSIKFLYLSGICCCGIYLIFHSCKFFALNTLANSPIYSMLCMSILALSIGFFIFLIYICIKNAFDKNYTFQSFDMQSFKKALNLLVSIAVIIVLSYPTHFKQYESNTTIVKVSILFETIWPSLMIILGIYILCYVLLDIFEHKMQKKN